jgi:hypothetical protein
MKLFLLLLILAMCGCGAPRVTSETPVTESQVRAYEASFYWAKQKGIRLDAVVFAPGFVTGTSGNETPGKATAWALCDHYAIGWNEEHIEIPGYVDFDCGAAHESCHIYYKDNLPCKKKYDEARARACAEELVGRRCSG